MHEIRPFRIVKPQRRTAFAAEMALAGTLIAALVFRVFHFRAIDLQRLFAGDLHRLEIAAEIDRIPAAALRLAADAAIAALIRVGMARAQAEAHGAAMARTFEQHQSLL